MQCISCLFLTAGLMFAGLIRPTTRARPEQCTSLFDAVVQVRGNLTKNFRGTAEHLRKIIAYWTNINTDDGIAVIRTLCQIVNANSIDEIVGILGIPRRLSFYYMRLKSDAEYYKLLGLDKLLLTSPVTLTQEMRQYFLACLNLMDVAGSMGLLSFDVPQPDEAMSGCRNLTMLGLRVYSDKEYVMDPIEAADFQERIKAMTGMDINDREQTSVFLCKLGEVSDLQELAAVLNIPVELVRSNYQRFASGIRLMEGVPVLVVDRVPTRMRHRLADNLLNFFRGVEELGLLDLTD